MRFRKFLRNHRDAFTLAEVVVVMAILSIMMVAFAPVVTKKTGSTSDAFKTFSRTNGNHGIYYGTSSADDIRPVIIGDTGLNSAYTSSIPISRLYLKTHEMTIGSSSYLTPGIAFMTNYDDKNNLSGQLIVAGANDDTDSDSIASEVSIILTDGAMKYTKDVGAKNMTIVGGNACANAEGAGVAGLTCIGAHAASGKDLTEATNATFIGYNAGSGEINPVANGIYIGDGGQNIPLSSIYIGDSAINEKICDFLGGNLSGDSCSVVSQQSTGGSEEHLDSPWNSINNTLGEHIQLTLLTGQNIPSDERLKNVGKPFTAGLDAINKINPVNFTYKRDKNKFPHVGVIAQALSPVFPNAISTNKDGYFYIRTEDMFYAAINAIKELYQMYLAHDKKIQRLEERSAVLEQQNKELQALYIELAKRVENLDKKKSRNINFTAMPVYDDVDKTEVQPEPVAEE